jgi:sigma-B regulation protein RsbU (phosphoserine phosphatase)
LEHSTSFLKINVGTKILTPGSVIFNYTEGLVENSDEEIYISDEELIEYLLQNKGLPVDSLNKNVLNGIQSANNAAMNSDDSTILTIRVL